MKIVLSNSMLMIACSIILTGCFFGSCGNWNCTTQNPRWKKARNDCVYKNFEIIKQKFGYKDYWDVTFSDIGQHVSYQCTHNSGRYNVEKDNKYGYLFAK